MWLQREAPSTQLQHVRVVVELRQPVQDNGVLQGDLLPRLAPACLGAAGLAAVQNKVTQI